MSVVRFTRRLPCPICNGADSDRRGKGIRCSGFFASDGLYAHCSRVECGRQEGAGTWAHRLAGPCNCGRLHAATPPPPPARPALVPPDFAAAWERLAAEDEEGIAYLTGRGLWPLTPGVVRFDTTDSLYRVAVQLFDATGRVVGIERRAIGPAEPKYRALPQSVKKGSTFGRIGGRRRIWLIEGLTDWLAASSGQPSSIAAQLGLRAIGVPGAALAGSVIEARVEQLRGCDVFLSFDGDAAGHDAREAAVHALRVAGAGRVLNAPYPAKDLAELVLRLGPIEAAEVMEGIVAEAWQGRRDVTA